ncbi:hypothetical protein Tco_0103195 [Tanacetum coccineum]
MEDTYTQVNRGNTNGKLIWKSIQNGPTPHPMITDPPPTDSAAVPAPREKLDSEFSEEETNLRWLILKLKSFLVKVFPDTSSTNSIRQALQRRFGIMWKCLCKDQVIRRCVSGQEAFDILKAFHNGPLRDTTVPITPLKRSSIQVSIGPRSTRMPTTMSPNVTFVNVKAKFHNVMRCHKTLSKFVKSLTYGGLILWGTFPFQEWEQVNTRGVDYLSKWDFEAKSVPPMTLELFANFLNLSSPDSVPLVQS